MLSTNGLKIDIEIRSYKRVLFSCKSPTGSTVSGILSLPELMGLKRELEETIDSIVCDSLVGEQENS